MSWSMVGLVVTILGSADTEPSIMGCFLIGKNYLLVSTERGDGFKDEFHPQSGKENKGQIDLGSNSNHQLNLK